MAYAFTADWKIDGEDFQRQLEEAGTSSSLNDIKEFITDSREAGDKMRDAKVRALLRARKKMRAAVREKFNEIYDRHLLPIGASADVDAWLDEGPLKVQP